MASAWAAGGRTRAAVVLCVAVLTAACGGQRAEPPAAAPSTAPPPTTRPGGGGSPSPTHAPAGTNPFGVMLASELVRRPGGMEVARSLGAVSYRPAAIFLDRWEGRCPECDAALRAGLALVLTVRASGPGPTAPPRDLAAYRRALGDVLDRYRPSVLVVENEENSALFYTGTPAEYAAQLGAACAVAHERGVPCTNGGLVSSLVALLVYDDARRAGDAARAERIARTAFTPALRAQFGSAKAKDQIAKGEALLSGYRAAGADFVNFHWYIADPPTLGDAVALLRARTGLPVITNEVGQTTDDPDDTTTIMRALVEVGIPIAVWFGLDGPKARGLVERDGTLRPTGEAFRRFVLTTFPATG